MLTGNCAGARPFIFYWHTQKVFLDTHLLHWAALWQDDVLQQARTDFWRIVTAATYRWLLEEAEHLACSVRQAKNYGGDPRRKQDRKSGMSGNLEPS